MVHCVEKQQITRLCKRVTLNYEVIERKPENRGQ